MRGKVAKGLRRSLDERWPKDIDKDTLYWQHPVTNSILRTTTCFRSLYQQAKRNYRAFKSNIASNNDI